MRQLRPWYMLSGIGWARLLTADRAARATATLTRTTGILRMSRGPPGPGIIGRESGSGGGEDPGPLAGRSQPGELPLHRVHLREVGARVVVAAALAGAQPEAPRRIGVASPRSAQVDDGGQILLSLRRGRDDTAAPDRARDLAIQQGRGHLDGVARHDPTVEGVEPARRRIEPGALLDHDVVVDAVAPRLAEGRVGDLVHADRAR